MPQTKQGAKNRAKTPDISVLDDYYQDPSALILAQAKAALGDTKSAGMDFRYGSSRPQAAEMDRLDGWVPVVTKDENGNEKQWRHRVDPLLMRPKGESDRVKARDAEVARSQLRNTIANKGDFSDSLTAE